MAATIGFLDHHHPAGMSSAGSGQSFTTEHGRKVITESDVSYAPGHPAPAFSAIQLVVEVVPGRHGRALARADVQVIWYPRRSPAEHLVSGDFRALTVSAWFYGTRVRHVRRTFRQQAIIDRLTTVLDGLPASPGGLVNCPAITAIYELNFKPVRGHADAKVSAVGCYSYSVWVGGHSEPALVDNGKLEKIAHSLMTRHPAR